MSRLKFAFFNLPNMLQHTFKYLIIYFHHCDKIISVLLLLLIQIEFVSLFLVNNSSHDEKLTGNLMNFYCFKYKRKIFKAKAFKKLNNSSNVLSTMCVCVCD